MGVALDQVPGFVVGIITGVISSLVVARFLDRRRRRGQVRQVTASVTRTWAPVPGQSGLKVMTGGYLTIKNNSEWPVRNVIVMEPGWLQKFDLRYLGPGREHVEPIPHDVLIANPAIDPPVTLQITDICRKVYQWRPATEELFDGSWIPWHCRPVQKFAQRFPNFWSRRCNPLMFRLPMKVIVWVWGYDPTGDTPPAKERMRPLV